MTGAQNSHSWALPLSRLLRGSFVSLANVFLKKFLCWIGVEKIKMHHFVRVYTCEWDNEVIFFFCLLLNFWLLSFVMFHASLPSLTFHLHVVRASVHAGDPAELRDTGHVSSLWGHRLRLREVQDPAGEAAGGSTCYGLSVAFFAHLVLYTKSGQSKITIHSFIYFFKHSWDVYLKEWWWERDDCT